MKFFIVFTIFTLFVRLSAAEVAHNFSDKQITEMSQHNKVLSVVNDLGGFGPHFEGLIKQTTPKGNWLPYAEYNEAGYLIINSTFDFNSQSIKEGLVKNLPANVNVVVFTGYNSKSQIKSIEDQFSQWISLDRLKVIYLPRGDRGFWARDGVPIPLVPEAKSQSPLTIVDAKYYHTFEADKEISEYFMSGLAQHDYFYEGGNFMANAKGDCIMVDNKQASQMPDSVFSDYYGCKTLVRLPHTKGIGHADESVKFVDDNTVLTDDTAYSDTLKAKGFEVIMLPRPKTHLETYVNSLIINGTVYLPVFNESTDAKAIKTYEDLGLKVVPLNSSDLSNKGAGSIHCITMTYPPVTFNELLRELKAKELKK